MRPTRETLKEVGPASYFPIKTTGKILATEIEPARRGGGPPFNWGWVCPYRGYLPENKAEGGHGPTFRRWTDRRFLINGVREGKSQGAILLRNTNRKFFGRGRQRQGAVGGVN